MRARGGPGAAPAQRCYANVVDIPAQGVGFLSPAEGEAELRRPPPAPPGPAPRRGRRQAEGAEPRGGGRSSGRLLPMRA